MNAQVPNALWRQVVRLAESQFGVVSWPQLLALGCSRDWIRMRLRRGFLRPVHRGVYAVGHEVLVVQGRWLAAALAVPGGVLSHRTAAAFWRMAVEPPAGVELTVAGHPRSRPGLTVHRSRTLTDVDLLRWHSAAVTRTERTIVDLAEVLGPDAFTRATDALSSVDRHALRAALERAGANRKAWTATAPLLDPGPRTRSELERAFLRMARRFGLARPQCNVRVSGLLVDAYWPDRRLVVECDSRRWHASWAARRNDHARDARLQRAGLRSLRVTWAEVCHAPEQGAARIRPFLA